MLSASMPASVTGCGLALSKPVSTGMTRTAHVVTIAPELRIRTRQGRKLQGYGVFTLALMMTYVPLTECIKDRCRKAGLGSVIKI